MKTIVKKLLMGVFLFGITIGVAHARTTYIYQEVAHPDIHLHVAYAAGRAPVIVIFRVYSATSNKVLERFNGCAKEPRRFVCPFGVNNLGKQFFDFTPDEQYLFRGTRQKFHLLKVVHQ